VGEVDVGEQVTTPSGSKPRASGMTQVCRPTPLVRFMHTSELSLRQQLVSRMARLPNTVVFLPTALHRGTHRNAIWFETYKRTTDAFFCRGEKTEMKALPDGSTVFILVDKFRSESPRFGKS